MHLFHQRTLPALLRLALLRVPCPALHRPYVAFIC
jgi:hypothetical protein